MTVNKLTAIGELEPGNQGPEREHWETELKLTPVDPHSFDFLKSMYGVQRIEQIYLSNPGEPYSLRVREITREDGSVRHTAALKAESRLVPNGQRRLETPTEISAEAFAHYQASPAPACSRSELNPSAVFRLIGSRATPRRSLR